MKRLTLLEKIGFTTTESTIYLGLLQLGPASISDIVRKTGIHRPTVYKTLPVLIEKGLVSIMPKGKYKIYVPASPQKLEKIFDELEDDFNAEIHALHETYLARDKKPTITYAEGDKAIKDAYSDVIHSLKKNDVYYRYSSALTLNRKKYVPSDYKIVRDRKQLERYIITDAKSKKLSSLRLGRQIKSVPDDFNLFDSNVTQIIYGNKVALIDYNSKTAIVIENAMIAEFQKKIFKLLYKKL